MFIRKYWIPIAVFIVAIVGVGLYYLQTRPPKEPIVIYKPVEPLPKSEVKTPVGDTSQGGHFHADGTWHEGAHDAPPTAGISEPVTPVSSEKTGPIVLPIPSGIVPDWTAMSPDELAAAIEAIERRHVAAPDGYYYQRNPDGRLLHNENGYPTLHKIGEPDFKVVKEIGFAPTREEYARYQQVQQEFAEAQVIGNTREVERLQRELQHMRDTFLGEIPTISYSLQTNDRYADIEALHKYAASRARHLRFEAYRKSGFEYLIPTEDQ